MSVRLLFELVVVLLFFNLNFITTTNLRKPIPNLPIPSPSPSPPTNANETCFEYELENECSSLLNNVNVNSTIQHILFDSISLNVSDVRMIPSDCRRPLLWFVCGLMFPRCPSETIEEQFCRQVEGCHQVNERCEPFDLSFDCLFPSFEEEEDEECSTKISKEIEEATENGIKVETCLGEQKETIGCCPDPFIVDFEGECIVECPQYEYGERYETSAQITLFVLLWVGVVSVFIGQFPLFMMSLNTRYPAYVLFLNSIAILLQEIFFSFAMFAGGTEEYLCGNEENYFVALNHFGRSRVAGVQMSFWLLFSNITVSLWAVQSLNTFCIIARVKWKFFKRFIDGPVSKWIQICLVVPCFFIPFALFLFCVIYFFTHNSSSDNLYLGPSPFVFAAFPFYYTTLDDILRIYSAICICTVTLFVVLSIVLVLGINYRIAFLQWRAMFIQFYFLIACGILLWFFLGSGPDRVIREYIECVGSHPRIDPPPCQRNPSEGRILIFLSFLVIFLFPVVISIVVFWTNRLVFGWWKEFVFKRKIVRNMSDLETGTSNSVSKEKEGIQ